MLLSQSTYFIFLFAVFLLYWPLSRWRTAALAIVLFANYFFYAKWSLVYLALIPAASTVDYLIGRGLGRTENRALRRLLVTLSIVMHLSLMASFKYMPFLFATWTGVTGMPTPQWHWSLPLGLSFYCFQSMTYTIDVYRKDGKPLESLLTHLSAVSFFPTTLAGPITRVLALAPQLEKRGRELTSSESGRALFRIGLGLAKKFLIADYLAENIVGRIFDNPTLYTGTETLVGVYAFALQLYYDFSGYTDMAIGSALLLGITLPENFKRPYLASSVADFWRRWHITLSNWLRDYLYFSLPGLRSKHKIFTYTNLVITMVLGGLWHGPNWTFAVWGLAHGAGLAVNHWWRGRQGNQRPAESGWAHWLSVFVTAQFVVLAWIPFRSPDLTTAGAVFARLFSGTVSFDNISLPIAVVMLVGLLGILLPSNWHDAVRARFSEAPFYAQAAALAALVFIIQYVADTGAAPFLYTRF